MMQYAYAMNITAEHGYSGHKTQIINTDKQKKVHSILYLIQISLLLLVKKIKQMRMSLIYVWIKSDTGLN